MSHESSVKEWRERAEAAEAKVKSYERQIRVMAHMLDERDASLRQIEFNQLAAQVEMQDGLTPDLEVVANDEDDGDDEVE